MLINHKAKLTKREKISDKVDYFLFSLDQEISFKAGQYINIKVSDTVRRSYSIGSQPSKKNEIELYIDLSPQGPGTIYLDKLEIGDEFEFIGPIGMFFIKEDESNDLIFIATGTGIAPHRSMYLDLLESNFDNNIKVLFGVRYLKDLFLVDELQELSEKHENFSYELILSKPENSSWKGKVGHVQDLINSLKVDFKTQSAYICGNQKMIFDVQELLKSKDMDFEDIHFEKFY